METVNKSFIISVLAQYILELIAFGCHRHNKKDFIFKTIACVYIMIFFSFKASMGVLNSGGTMNRALNGGAVFFQIFHYLKCNSYLT